MIIGNLLLIGWVAAAEPQLPELRVGWRGANARVRVIEPEGEHLADGAPVKGWVAVNGVRIGIETTSEGLSPGLGVALPGKDSHELSGSLSFSLCEDGGTICRIVELGFWGMVQGMRGNASLSVFGPGEDLPNPESDAVDLEAALALAVKENKPLLLDFSATWCPPCNLLAAEVLDAPDADAPLSDFVVVVFDADLQSSWEAKDTYQVGGYPTVIVARPDGSVLDRMEGYPGKEETLAWLEAARDAELNLDELASSAESLEGEEAAQAALRLARAGRTEAAGLALEKAADGVEMRMARLALSHSNEDGLWLAENAPGQMHDWVWSLLEAEAISSELQEAILNAMPTAMAQVRGADAAALAEWSAQWSEPPQQQIQYAMVAAMLQEGLTGTPRLDRGVYTLLAHMQAGAGRPGDAVATLKQAVAYFPEEFTYHNALSVELEGQGRLEEALSAAQAATGFAYGDNRLRAVHQEASLLHQLDRSDEALNLLSATLDGAQRPEDGVEVRTHRYLSKLETLKTELTASP